MALLVSVSVLAACAPGDAEPNDEADTAAMAEFYEQKLEWGACDADFATSAREAEVLAASPAECARLSVPLDYDDPQGAKASVAVSRMAATGTATGTLVFNTGGPGGSGVIGSLALGVQLAESRITAAFDIVGFDPRGVGATIPAAHCYTPDGPTRADELFPTLGSRPELTEADTQAVFDQCAEGSGGADALVNMGTRTTAKDMDVLRAALGEEKLTYLGQSYGTRLGAVYAEEFPDRVRAMILDGAFDPTRSTSDRFISSYTGFQASFDAMAALCTQDVQCPLGTDPAAATSVFQSIVQPLREQPVPALDTELDFDGAIGAVILGLYAPQNYSTVIAGIAELQEGRGDILLQLIIDQTSGSTDPETAVNGNATEALFAINCMDEERLTPEEVSELNEMTYEAAPFMDRGQDVGPGARDACEQWPAEPTLGFPYAQGIEGLPETLVISFTADPTTPHSGGIALADTLGSSLLTLEGAQHTVVSGGANACVNELAADYLIDLELPEEMPDCTP